MSDTGEKRELDDELISAYLDDELSGEDRAVVERRLAADPAAQRLLHELRMVSQSVQGMPQENLGRDLSATIVELIEQERKPTPSPTDGSKPGGSLPRLPVFGSRRAWIWASLALAAGVLIMFVERGDEPANKLAPVAQPQRSAPVGQIAENEAAREPSIEANRAGGGGVLGGGAASPPPNVIASDRRLMKESPSTVAPGQAPMSGQIANGPEAAAPAGSPGLAASAPGVATTKPISELNGARAGAAGPRPSGTISGSSQWAGQVATSGTAKSFGGSGGGQAEIKEREPLVVQVVMSPEAFEKNSFERLLASNGIEIESDAKKQADSLDLGASRFKVSREKQPAVAAMPAKKA